MKVANQTGGNIRKSLGYNAAGLVVTALAVALVTAGCGSYKNVRLTPTAEVRETFEKVDINPDAYAFFTTGPDAMPEAILLIDNNFLGEFDSGGWKLRDKQLVMELLKSISQKKSLASKYGYPVMDDHGIEKGMLYTTFRVGKVFIDKEEGSFRVATPAMLDTGKGAYKRTGCSISICQ